MSFLLFNKFLNVIINLIIIKSNNYMKIEREDFVEKEDVVVESESSIGSAGVSNDLIEISNIVLDKEVVSDDFLNSKSEGEVIDIFKECLFRGDIAKAKYLKDKFIKDDRAISNILLNEFKFSLSEGDIFKVINIRDEFSLGDKFTEDREIMDCAVKGFENALNDGDISFAKIIKESFSLKEDMVSLIAKRVIDEYIAKKDYSRLDEIKNNFLIDSGLFDDLVRNEYYDDDRVEEIVESEEVRREAEKAFIYYLSEARMLEMDKIKKVFKLDDNFLNSLDVKKAAIEAFSFSLNNDDVAKAIYIKNEFNLMDESVKTIISDFLIDFLSKGNVYSVLNLKEEFSFVEDFLREKEVVLAAVKGYKSNLNEGNVGFAKIIKESFLQGINVNEVTEKFINDYIFKGEIVRANEIRDSLIN